MNKLIWSFLFTIGSSVLLTSQSSIQLLDLSAFRQPVKENWKITGELTGDNFSGGPLKTLKGQGVLVCEHTTGQAGLDYDLFTNESHGDLDLELDFVMAKGSNSGIYLQGRYEVQLFDSWGVQHPQCHDAGGIYERWNEAKPDGQKGYEGVAPRINVAKAPGLWQHIKISFQSPRFDATGKKISNAKFISIILNGVIIHENVEVTGPTRGAVSNDEVALAPLRFQGDHGHVAFRHMQWSKYTQDKLSFTELKYGVYKGPFKTIEDIARIQPTSQGNETLLNWAVSNEENDFGIKYSGKLNVPVAGKYTFTMVHGGLAQLKINNQPVFAQGFHMNSGSGRLARIDLPAGELPFELYYWKTDAWLAPSLGLFVESESIRKQPLHLSSSALVNDPRPQIFANPDREPMVLRSFMDIPTKDGQSKRITHAVSVGDPSGIHYTYDLDRGTMIQQWRGKFLNTAPMWYDRGDGSSTPMGSVTYLADTVTVSNPTSSSTTAFRTKGYELDAQGNPTFIYELNGRSIQDKIIAKDDGRYLERTWTTAGDATLDAIIAIDSTINPVNETMYAIGDNAYYIRIMEGKAGIKPTGADQVLVMHLGKTSKIQIIW